MDNKAQDVAVSTRELEVDALAAGGRGVARADGQVWFVPGAFPGDRVLARAGRVHPRFVEGRLLRLLRPSPDRRDPACPLQGHCGGCPWMPLPESLQGQWKRRHVADALVRLGQAEVEVEPIRTAPQALGYRNKVELTLGRDASGNPAVGLYAHDRDGGLVDVGCCFLQHRAANALLDAARGWLHERAEAWLDEEVERRDPYRVILRRSWHDGGLLVGLRSAAGPFPQARELAEHLCRNHPELVGVVELRGLAGQRGGTRSRTLRGRNWLEERIGRSTFRVPVSCFLQVHPAMAAVLLELVVELVGPVGGKTLVDLYGGVGSFGFELARRGARVTVSEADPVAVAAGRDAARRNRVDVRFVRGRTEAFLKRSIEQGRKADVVVANPPRTGMGPRVPKGIRGLQPRRVVLVSCDPATLARDTRRLMQAGYRPLRAIPLDLFPQTAHVETVLLLESR